MQNEIIEVKIGYSLKIEVCKNAMCVTLSGEINDFQFEILKLAWPLVVEKVTTGGIRLQVLWDDNTMAWCGYYDPNQVTRWYCTFTGKLLDGYTWNWMCSRMSKFDVLWEHSLEGNANEVFSFEDCESYHIFNVDSVWREVGFVTDDNIKYLVLYINSIGISEILEWTEEEYQQETKQFEKWYEEQGYDLSVWHIKEEEK